MIALAWTGLNRTISAWTPYETDPAKWLELPWIDRYSGLPWRVGTADAIDGPEMVRLQTFHNVVREFWTHPEAKSAGPDGRPCGRQTVGLLQRRTVQESHVVHVGKEGNELEAHKAGLVTEADR